jgi:pilus assembly protein CpaB
MKSKSLILLMIALGCGLVAMLGVQQVMKRNQGHGEDHVSVLYTRTDISSGVKLELDKNVEFRPIPKSMVSEQMVTHSEQFENRALRAYAVADEPVLRNKLGEPGTLGAAASIPEGMTIVGLKVDNTSSLSAHIQPGNRVGVFVTRTRQVNGQVPIKQTLLVVSDVVVHSIDKITDGNTEEAKKVSKVENVQILCTFDQAARLTLAKDSGSIQLVLRNPNDKTDLSSLMIDESNLDGRTTKTENRDEATADVPAVEDLAPMKHEDPKPAKSPADLAREYARANPAPAPVPDKRVWKLHIVPNGRSAEPQVHLIDLPPEPTAAVTPESTPAAIPVKANAPVVPVSEPSVEAADNSPANEFSMDQLLKRWFGRPKTRPVSQLGLNNETAAQ